MKVTVLGLGLLESIQLVLLVLQRAPQLVICHEAGHDVDGDGEHDRAVVLRRDPVQRL